MKEAGSEFLVARIFRPSSEETERYSSSCPGAWTKAFKSGPIQNKPHAERLDQCFPNYPDSKELVQTDVEVDAGRHSMCYRMRVAETRGSKDKVFASITELTRENGAECSATERESASRSGIQAVSPRRQFFRIEPRQGILPAAA